MLFSKYTQKGNQVTLRSKPKLLLQRAVNLQERLLHVASQNPLQPSNPYQSPLHDSWNNFFFKCWFAGNLVFWKGKNLVSFQKGYDGLNGSFPVISCQWIHTQKFTSTHTSFSLRLSSKSKRNCDRQLSSTNMFGLHWHLFQNHPELSIQVIFSSMSDLDLWDNVSYTTISWAIPILLSCSFLVPSSTFSHLKIFLNTKF